MARSRACLCSQLFLIFLALTSLYVSENTLGSEVSGVVFSIPGQILAATQMEFHHKSSMHAFGSMSATLYSPLVAKDILLQESTTTEIQIAVFT